MQAGFKLSLDKPEEFRGFWWWEDSKDKMPWSATRSTALNETAQFEGAITVHGDVEATGVLGAAGIQSSTVTTPTVQESLGYQISAISCHWKRTELDPSCGAPSSKQPSSTWGGMANVKVISLAS